MTRGIRTGRRPDKNNSVEKHPGVILAMERRNSAVKALKIAETELTSYQNLLQRTLAGQIDALERDLDQKNPLNKHRIPMTTGKIREHILTSSDKVRIATEVVEKRQNEYFDACESALKDLRSEFDAKYKEKVKSLSESLARAAKWNTEVFNLQQEAQGMGYKVEFYAWPQLMAEHRLAASKLASWQLEVSKYLES